MEARRWALVLLEVVVQAVGYAGGSSLKCPAACECRLFRINWVADCSGLGLTDLPYADLSAHLYELDFSDNHLTEIGPFPRDVANLRRLLLAKNALSEVPKDVFFGLESLVELDLSYNNITTIESDTFRRNLGLIKLNLRNNPLENGNSSLLASRSLRVLDLRQCALSNLSAEFLTEVPGLHSLDLSGNPLTTLRPGVFDAQKSLRYLKLNDCSLGDIDSGVFSQLGVLKTLEVTDNAVNLDWVRELVSLEVLDLRRCNVTALRKGLFAFNTYLSSLLLSGNPLSTSRLGTTLGNNIRSLSFLDMSYCSLEGPFPEEAFGEARSLKSLSLAGNRLSEAGLPSALRPSIRLERLVLRDAGIVSLPAGAFCNMSRLRSLDVSHNPLVEVPLSLSSLGGLLELDMSRAGLRRVPGNAFAGTVSLRTLVLSGNPLEALEPGLFRALTSLERLDLSDCGLAVLPENAFGNDEYPKLATLSLAGNPLAVDDALVPRQLTKLLHLDLSRCGIRSVPSRLTRNLRQLATLDLSHNSLTSLEFLKNLVRLERLDLSGNGLASIDPADLRDNPSVLSVKLAGNPWVCGCYVLRMVEWAAGKEREGMLLADVLPSLATKRDPGSLHCLLGPQNVSWLRYAKRNECRPISLPLPPIFRNLNTD